MQKLFTDSFPLCESDDLILKHAARNVIKMQK